MAELVRHRQTKGSATARLHLNHRATPRLHKLSGFDGGISPETCRKRSLRWHRSTGKTELSPQRLTGSRPVCLGGRPVRVQRFSRPSSFILSIYNYHVGSILKLESASPSFLLHLGMAERGGFEPPLGCLFPKTV